MSCWNFLLLLFSLVVETGTIVPFLMPFNGIAHLNCSAMCGSFDPPGVSCIAGEEFIPFSNSVSNCCPVIVLVTFSISGVPTKNDLGVTCEIRCGNEIVKTCSWSIHFTGIASVSAINYNGNTGLLKWSPPFFYSGDIPQGETPVYNILVNGVSVANTTDTSVWLSHLSIINNCSTTTFINIIASIGKYQSSKNETLRNNVCNATLINSTEFYNPIEGTFSTNIIFQVESNIKVCSFTCFIYIDYGDGTISNDSFEVHVPPSEEKSVTTSHIINGLVPGTNRIKISFNSTKDILNLTIIVPSNPKETSSEPINPTSSFHFSFIYATTTSSMTEGSIGIGTTSSNVVNETPVTSSSPSLPDGGSTSANITIIIVASSLITLISLSGILLFIIRARKPYRSCIKKEPEEEREVESTDVLSNNCSPPVIDSNSLNSATATKVTIAPATEMAERTLSDHLFALPQQVSNH